jgi:methionyl-tRNA formyltransferase
MRIVFMGSPEPVLAPLSALIERGPAHGHELVAVVSQPARPVGRKGVLTDPPVAQFAKARGIRTLQPEKASAPDFLAELQDLAADVIVTAAYGQILSDAFLQVPRRATINIHPSLLPRYRGATPVQAALLDGETQSGVTVLFTVKRLDAGAVIAQRATPIAPDESAGALMQRYFELGGELLFDALDKLRDPAFTGTPQDEARVTHCRKIQKHDGLVDWTLPADEIHNRFRAYDPWPGTYTFCQGKRLGLIEVTPDAKAKSPLEPGEVVFDKKLHALQVGTGDGIIHVAKVKPAGGKDVPASAFWNGLKERSAVRFDGVDGSAGGSSAT